MSRGFLAGAMWGCVVAGVGLGAVSLVTMPPEREVADTKVTAEPSIVPRQAPESPAAVDSGTDPDSQRVVEADAMTAEETMAAEEETSAAAPEVLPEPVILPEMPTDANTPDRPEPEAVQPEEMAALSAEDAPPAGLVSEDLPLAAPSGAELAPPQMSGEDDMAPDALPDTNLPDINLPAANLPEAGLPASAPADVAPDAVAALPLPPLTAQEQAMLDAANEVEPTDIIITDAPEAEMTASDDRPGAASQEAAQEEVAQEDPAQDGADAPAEVLQETTDPVLPQPGFAAAVDGVQTGRLPVVGDTPSAQPAPAEPPVVEQPVALAPVERFARPFDNPAAKPVFAVLLRDTGGADLDRTTLANLPFPVSFVIDPAQPDAEEAATIYRAAGQEVVMLAAGLPAGANPSDIAVSFEAWGQVLPEAVAVLDPQSGGYQSNRTLAAQVLAVVGDQGRGVLSWERGLNAVSQIARREGMENATIYRNLDAEDESAPIIRRYLDRAAFKAAQDGRVLVMGRTRPETIAALLEWAVEGRAATVALGPVTAAMTSQ